MDEQGNLHVTDRLHDVPEPFYSMYEARLRELAKQRGGGQETKSTQTPRKHSAVSSQEPRRVTKTRPDFTLQQIRRRKFWQELVARWRRELAAATEELNTIDQEIATLQMNPILRHTPAVKAQVAEAQSRRAKALQRVMDAREALLKDIPLRARKEKVPPKWLL